MNDMDPLGQQHLSLSKTTALRAHHIEPFVQRLKEAVKSSRRCVCVCLCEGCQPLYSGRGFTPFGMNDEGISLGHADRICFWWNDSRVPATLAYTPRKHHTLFSWAAFRGRTMSRWCLGRVCVCAVDTKPDVLYLSPGFVCKYTRMARRCFDLLGGEIRTQLIVFLARKCVDAVCGRALTRGLKSPHPSVFCSCACRFSSVCLVSVSPRPSSPATTCSSTTTRRAPSSASG